MKKYRQPGIILIVLVFLCLPVIIFAESPGGNIVYFYITGCTSCGRAEEILKKTAEFTTADKYNIIDAELNALFLRYCEVYEVPEHNRITPLIFAGERYFSGAAAIENEFPIYAENNTFETPLLSAGAALPGINLLRAFITGILNGLNPCSLSILILLATLLAARQLHILSYGIAYCLGKFITYFAIGTVFYTFVLRMGFQNYLMGYKIAMTLICLFFIIFNIFDFLAARKEDYKKIRLQLPGRLKELNYRLVKQFSSKGNTLILPVICFGTGVVTSVGEFFCTGQIYIATILSMIHNRQEFQPQALLFLFTYSLGFIIPFLTITVLLHKGAEVFDISDLIRKHLPLIKAANTLIFAGILVFVLLS